MRRPWSRDSGASDTGHSCGAPDGTSSVTQASGVDIAHGVDLIYAPTSGSKERLGTLLQLRVFEQIVGTNSSHPSEE